MAILNYGKNIIDLQDRLGIGKDAAGYLELIFSSDGHIITHGQDYLKDFVSGNRGLVPNYPDSSTTKILGKNGWSSLTTAHLPIHTSGSYDTSTILNSSQIYTLINNLVGSGIAANDAMVFKGPISSPDDIPTSGYSKGWTYRITAIGVYLGTACQPGDLLIAKSDAEENQSSINTEHWFVVDTNVKGLTNININGLGFQFSGNSVSGETTYQSTIYGPENAGTVGWLLTATGNTPIWKDPSAIQVGKATTADTAAKLANSISFGNGLTQADFDGSATRTISLQKASTNAIGGVQIGNNITITDGTISLTTQNILDALGFMPGHAEAAVDTYAISGTGVTINLLKTTTEGDSSSTVSAGAYEIPVVSISNPGVVPQLPADSTPKFFKSNGTWEDLPANAYLNTTYSFSGGTNKFTVTPNSGDAYDVNITPYIANNVTFSGSIVDGNIATFNGASGVIKSTALKDLVTKTYITQTLGAYATENTWRPIEVGDTEIGDSVKLRFIPTESIAVSTSDLDPNNTDTFDIGFNLYWYNLETNEYETV